MHNTLKRLGFESMLLSNPRDMDAVMDKLEEFTSKLRGATAVFFFAGHGTQNSDKQTFLLTLKEVAHEDRLDTNALALDKVLTMMRKCQAKSIIVLLDACRTNAPRFGFGPDGRTRDAAATRGMKVTAATAHPVLQASGSVIAWACGDGQAAGDGGRGARNGVFTKHLLRHMARGRSVNSILEDVAAGVLEETRGAQSPAIKCDKSGEPMYLAPSVSKRFQPFQAAPSVDASAAGGGSPVRGLLTAAGWALAIGGAFFVAAKGGERVAALLQRRAAHDAEQSELTAAQRAYTRHLAKELAEEAQRVAAAEA
jgi:uncharacterized caspase-like protein